MTDSWSAAGAGGGCKRLGQVKRVVVIADGALWIWNLTKDRFPEAASRRLTRKSMIGILPAGQYAGGINPLIVRSF